MLGAGRPNPRRKDEKPIPLKSFAAIRSFLRQGEGNERSDTFILGGRDSARVSHIQGVCDVNQPAKGSKISIFFNAFLAIG